MKKFIIAIMCIASVGAMRAEDVLQVVPFETKAGATVDDGLSFSVVFLLKNRNRQMTVK